MKTATTIRCFPFFYCKQYNWSTALFSCNPWHFAQPQRSLRLRRNARLARLQQSLRPRSYSHFAWPLRSLHSLRFSRSCNAVSYLRWRFCSWASECSPYALATVTTKTFAAIAPDLFHALSIPPPSTLASQKERLCLIRRFFLAPCSLPQHHNKASALVMGWVLSAACALAAALFLPRSIHPLFSRILPYKSLLRWLLRCFTLRPSAPSVSTLLEIELSAAAFFDRAVAPRVPPSPHLTKKEPFLLSPPPPRIKQSVLLILFVLLPTDHHQPQYTLHSSSPPPSPFCR